MIAMGPRKTVDMPREISGDGRAALEQFGVQFYEKLDGLFNSAVLPVGWTRALNRIDTVDDDIIDEKGRRRVAVECKLTGPDTWAYATVLPRITVQRDSHFEERHVGTRIIVTDIGDILYATNPILVPRNSSRHYDAAAPAYDEARAWCEQHRPDWRNPAAYWD